MTPTRSGKCFNAHPQAAAELGELMPKTRLYRDARRQALLTLQGLRFSREIGGNAWALLGQRMQFSDVIPHAPLKLIDRNQRRDIPKCNEMPELARCLQLLEH